MERAKFIPEKNTAITHPDWYSLTMLRRIDLSYEQIETLLINEVSTKSRKSVLNYFIRACVKDPPPHPREKP